MGKTSIEWTDFSWPVVNGCRRISPGCGGASGVGGCYAERLISTRLRHLPKYQGLAEYRAGGPRWTGETRLWRPDLAMPLRLRKPSRIFVADMGDLFYEGVSDDNIDDVFGVMAACRTDRHDFPRHTFQVLTKRAERMRAYLSTDRRDRWATAAMRVCGGGDETHEYITQGPEVLPHVHVGVSVEDQQRADERIPELLQTRAAVRWISAEPLLGPLRLHPHIGRFCGCGYPDDACDDWKGKRKAGCRSAPRTLDWIVVGSESGRGARPMDVAWARRVVDDCVAAGVPVFTKQIATPEGVAAGAKKGGDPAYWPPGNWPREFPAVCP